MVHKKHMHVSNQRIGSFPFSSNTGHGSVLFPLFFTKWNGTFLSKTEEVDPSGAFPMNKHWESAHMPFQFLLSGSISIFSEWERSSLALLNKQGSVLVL